MVQNHGQKWIANAGFVFVKELVLPEIGQDWQDVKIDGMLTQCLMYSSSVLNLIFFFIFIMFT